MTIAHELFQADFQINSGNFSGHKKSKLYALNQN